MQVSKKYMIDKKKLAEIVEACSAFLMKETAISFAYLYGSIKEAEGFNDIDVAVYVDETTINVNDIFSYQLDLAVRLQRKLGLPVDIRALNIAPLSFCFSVITRGDLICLKDERKMVSFEAKSRNLYFDFKYHTDFFYRKMLLG